MVEDCKHFLAGLEDHNQVGQLTDNCSHCVWVKNVEEQIQFQDLVVHLGTKQLQNYHGLPGVVLAPAQ